MSDENINYGTDPEAVMDSVINIEELIDLYGGDVLKLCMMYLGDRSRADDAYQDTFVKVYSNLTTLSNVSSKKAWIMRVAVNVCKDSLKSYWWQKVMKGGNIDGTNNYNPPVSPDTVDKLVEVKLQSNERKKVIFECVNKLPRNFRDVVIMYYFQERDTKQIALALDIPEGTVRSRLHRSRKLLHNSLVRWYKENEI